MMIAGVLDLSRVISHGQPAALEALSRNPSTVSKEKSYFRAKSIRFLVLDPSK
jgi:hypothetical protein